MNTIKIPFTEKGKFPLKKVEDALDRITFHRQEIIDMYVQTNVDGDHKKYVIIITV